MIVTMVLTAVVGFFVGAVLSTAFGVFVLKRWDGGHSILWGLIVGALTALLSPEFGWHAVTIVATAFMAYLVLAYAIRSWQEWRAVAAKRESQFSEGSSATSIWMTPERRETIVAHLTPLVTRITAELEGSEPRMATMLNEMARDGASGLNHVYLFLRDLSPEARARIPMKAHVQIDSFVEDYERAQQRPWTFKTHDESEAQHGG